MAALSLPAVTFANGDGDLTRRDAAVTAVLSIIVASVLRLGSRPEGWADEVARHTLLGRDAGTALAPFLRRFMRVVSYVFAVTAVLALIDALTIPVTDVSTSVPDDATTGGGPGWWFWTLFVVFGAGLLAWSVRSWRRELDTPRSVIVRRVVIAVLFVVFGSIGLVQTI